jgi:hypothetical protein
MVEVGGTDRDLALLARCAAQPELVRAVLALQEWGSSYQPQTICRRAANDPAVWVVIDLSAYTAVPARAQRAILVHCGQFDPSADSMGVPTPTHTKCSPTAPH